MWCFDLRPQKGRKTATKNIPMKHRRNPLGELAVQRGSRVRAIDGKIGWIDKFLVDPSDGHITYLILRVGHPWCQKGAIIPASQIDRIEKDTVHLKLDKQRVKALAVIPMPWRKEQG